MDIAFFSSIILVLLGKCCIGIDTVGRCKKLGTFPYKFTERNSI